MIFPFSAIVGQDEMKRALLLNVIDPSIGGVLIMGEKGTAKSTTVRALADLLPPLAVVEDCPFGCDPEGFLCNRCRQAQSKNGQLVSRSRKMGVVELPLGVTEDRLVGSLDIAHALSHGETRFEPGILAAANRNFLYVDEVNLLEDHIVDLLLDSAAMGVNTVEREGISFTHPAQFILVGTMNPEEGELRPQLLDRFGMCVTVSAIQDTQERMTILKRRLSFDADPLAFAQAWFEEQMGVAGRLMSARNLLSQVHISDADLMRAVEMAIQLELVGHRGEIAIIRAARALAAWNSRRHVSDEEIQEASWMAIRHRIKRLPFEMPSMQTQPMADRLGR